MSKKSRVKARKQKRSEEQSKKQQTTMMAVGAIALVIIAALAYFFIQNNREMEVTERMLLDPVLGNPDAPILIEEYAAYGCSACKAVHEQGILEAILAEYPTQVKIVFKDFPVIIPAYDRASAEVTQCAFDQGNEQFWILHDWMYTEAIQGSTNQDQIIQAASELGLDGEALRQCVRADTHQATVQYDLERGLELGISGTPTFFVNGERMFGFEHLVDTIEAEIARLGL